MKKITLSVAALTIAMMSFGQTQCKELTKDSVQCKNTTKTEVNLCHIHNPNHISSSKKLTFICSGTTKKNNKCKNKTKNLKGLCHNHKKDQYVRKKTKNNGNSTIYNTINNNNTTIKLQQYLHNV